MRLFVALKPPDPVLEELDRVVAPHQQRHPELRWVARDRQHITLSFLGDVDEATADRLRVRLADTASRHSRLVLSFTGAGAFPRPSRARVLWMGVSGDRDGLIQLATSVAADARRSGIKQERREFSPHFTLARCRQPGDVRPLVAALSSYAGGSWTADAVHLIRSHLGPTPQYETLTSWPLG